MASQKGSAISEELRTSPLAGFAENLILSTAADDFTTHVWEPKTLALLHSYNTERYIPGKNCVVSLSEELFGFMAAADKKPSLLFWRWDKDETDSRAGSLYIITCLKYRQGDNGFIQIFDERTGKLLCSRQLHLQPILYIEASIDSGVIVTVGADRFIKVWILSRLIAEEQTNLVPHVQIYGHTLAITGIAMGHYSTFIYSCSKDMTVKCWDLFNGNELAAFTLPSPINTMAMDNTETWIYVGCDNGNVYGIMRGSDKHITMSAHKKPVTAITLTGDNKYIVSGAADGEIYVWDGAEHKPLKSLHIHKTTITNIVGITRPINLYGLNANVESIQKVEIPRFQKAVGQPGEIEPWIKIKEEKEGLKEIYDEVEREAIKKLIGTAKEKEEEQPERKLDIPMTEVEQLREENRKLKRAFKELYRVKFDE